MLPQSLTHFRIYWLSTYAVDVHFLSRELVLIQDAFYSGVHVFPDGVTKVVNDGKIKNPQYIFKNKPVPSFQLLEVPSRLDPKKQPGHESQPSFVLPVSRGYLFSKNALELYMIRLLDLIEKTLVLDKMHRRLNLLKDASQVDYFHHDESSLRVIWTTEVVKAALSFKGDRSCQILIVPQKPDLMAQYQLTSTDGKPFSDCLTTRVRTLFIFFHSHLLK